MLIGMVILLLITESSNLDRQHMFPGALPLQQQD
jgi:hypothetical protein